jgi:hypothetical protein
MAGKQRSLPSEPLIELSAAFCFFFGLFRVKVRIVVQWKIVRLKAVNNA